ncbi:hypothetical protein BKA70DRAFT_1575506 [Coprinopsis sp. MPI-PUGE-AT-0042]|nr:hypothetical protein BKA70DRAFT_1575506 [Coprinopsis sp. MPI-PUGE-AT-0042]
MKPDPGLIPFLKVNDPLPDWLLTRLDTYLEHRAQRIQFCQDEAARLRREAESLEHESRRLQFQSDIYATLRNPMRRIPPEILAKIMHWVLGGPRGFVNQSGRIHFLQLWQVAKQWRRTAYSTPSLWRFLSIDLEDFPNPTAGPSVALVTLTRRLDWWFGHAGQNAEVHLDLGIDRYSWPERVSWIGSIWGPNAKQFRLVTVQLWGQLVLGPDVQDKYPSMENLKNLSISEHISDVEQKFPALESLKFSLLNLRASLDRPFRHSRLRSLFLSSLSLEHQSFAPILAHLPVLEELIMDSCYYNNIPSISATHSITNTSLRRLVATGSVLVRWHRISFPSLQFCQIIPNTNKEFLRRWDEPYTNHLLNVITDFLERCNARNLTLDLTRSSMTPAEVIYLLSSLSALRSLRLATTAAIFPTTRFIGGPNQMSSTLFARGTCLYQKPSA